jgi:hypothetical protein
MHSYPTAHCALQRIGREMSALPSRVGFRSWLRHFEAGSPMHQAESSSSSFCLWTGLSLPAALHPASRRRSCLPLRTVQCFCPMRTFTPLLVRTFRRTSIVPPGRMRSFASYPALRTGLLSERPSGTKIFQVFNDQPPASGAYILGALHLPDNPG